jgi:RNA polymerase sigma factor (sigma-70 family)
MEGATEVEHGTPVDGVRARPSSPELFTAAVELISGGRRAFESTARRYSLCAADAEDAYQRGLEILITKAPTAERRELKPWLHTVIKHEALAIRRQRERLLDHDAEQPSASLARASNTPGPDEGVAERERARHTAEALRQLKPSELHCLLLKALGYSYDEIATRTGYSWTKVNRCLTEGRRRFFDRFDQIQSGERCEFFRPLISAVSDGEATPREELELKQHLERCDACRAALRGYRSLPARLAQLLPPAAILPSLERGSWWSRIHDAVVGGAGDRVGALGVKLQQAGEVVTGQKAAAVVASTAAIAGGAAVHENALPGRSSHHARATKSERADARNTRAAQAQSDPVPAQPPDAPAPAPQAREGSPDRATTESSPTGAGEFDLAASAPSARAASSTESEPATSAAPKPDPSLSLAPSPSSAPAPSGSATRHSGSGGRGGEFGP